MNTLNLLEAEWHAELDVCGGIGVVSQLLVVVETIVLGAHAKSLVPLEAILLPVLEPLHLRAGLAEELHLHLLKLTHTEYELASHYLVAESLSYLCDTEGQLHAAGLLHVEVVDKDTLGGLGTQVNLVGSVGDRTHLGREHQVELAHICPVLGAADRVYDVLVEDYLLQFLKVGTLHCLGVTCMKSVALLLMLEHTGIGSAEFLLIKGVAELLGGLGNLLVYLLLVLGYLVFDEHVGTITLLGVAVIDKWVVERIDVAGSLPHGRVHEDGGVDTHDIAVHQHHRLPPIFLDIILKLNAVLTVVIHGGETVVNV